MKWIKQRENQIFFSVTIVALVVAICPLLSRYCLLGHDSSYHILRIEALKQQIEMGRPFLKVNPIYFGGMGYASSLFYPDFLIYIPALLRVLGMSIGTSYHIFMIVCIVLCYTLSYVCGKKITKNRYIGILFAVIITLAQYHLDDIIIRAAAGEYTAFIFVPIVVYGIYNMCFENFDKPWVLGAGMGLVLLCHTLSFAMCIAMLVIMLVFNFDVFLKKPSLIIKLIVTGLITLGATFFYWAPMVEQFLSAKFYVSHPWIEPVQEAVKVSSIFGFTFPTLGIGLMVLLLPRVLLFRNDDDRVMKFADQCIVTGMIFAFMASELVPWKTLGSYLTSVQFPWRFYVASTVLLSLGAAVVVYRLAGAICIGASDTPKEYDDEAHIIDDDSMVNKYGLVLALVVAIMTVSAIYNFSMTTREYYDFSNDYFDYKPFTCSVIGGEWLPEAVDNQDDLVETCDNAYAKDGTVLDIERDRGSVIINLDKAYGYVDVPLVYYKGYEAKTDDGTSVHLDGKGINGLVRVYTGTLTGKVTVRYEGTIIQKLSDIFSFQVILGLILIVCTIKSIKKELYG